MVGGKGGRGRKGRERREEDIRKEEKKKKDFLTLKLLPELKRNSAAISPGKAKAGRAVGRIALCSSTASQARIGRERLLLKSLECFFSPLALSLKLKT